MGLHIEITGELSPGEWKGVKALAMIALGEISLDALTVASVRPGMANGPTASAQIRIPT
jgi:hypothetical protein